MAQLIMRQRITKIKGDQIVTVILTDSKIQNLLNVKSAHGFIYKVVIVDD